MKAGSGTKRGAFGRQIALRVTIALPLVVAAVAIGLVSGAQATPSSPFTVVDLGTLGGGQSSAADINNRGQVVGNSTTSSGDVRPFLWVNGVMSDLGTLGGRWTWATGINDRGQVVGSSFTETGVYHAFLWEDGVMTDLGTLGGSHSYAQDINELGQVVGCSSTTSGPYDHAFLWEDGTMSELDTPSGDYSCAASINDHGQIAGTWIASVAYAVLWEDGVRIDLGNLGLLYDTHASRISNRGQVIGYSLTEAGFHWFLWEDGIMRDLTPDATGGSPSGPAASGINERGQIVGTLYGPTPNDAYAALWDRGNLTALAPFSSGQSGATAINNRGQAVGFAPADGGNTHATLWQAAP